MESRVRRRAQAHERGVRALSVALLFAIFTHGVGGGLAWSSLALALALAAVMLPRLEAFLLGCTPHADRS